MTAKSPTNFFARQQAARKSCRNQLIVFSAAVLIIVLVTAMAIRVAWYLYIGTQSYLSFNAADAHHYQGRLSAFTFFDPVFFIFVSGAIVIVILAASLIKMNTLQRGGAAVAEMLGGRCVEGKTTEPAERRLINVVEEMAIASGIPVPKIYILDSESGINAFAAGLELTDAAVAVTRGTLDKLTRDELQGVIAHEFSHILNGDMRLNMQLIGILFGILFLGIAGKKFLSTGRVSLRVGLPAVVAGIFLVIIGYLGSFLGRLMQCSIARQQELLADASAVQFTRNPLGLAGALKKIGGFIFGSGICSPEAIQASHLFFGESHPDKWFWFLNTHPPLITRIRLLDPSFDGKFPKIKEDPPASKPQYNMPFWGTSQWGDKLRLSPGESPALAMAAAVTASVGNPSAEQVGHSRTILTSIPGDIRDIFQTPQGAASVIFSLLIGPDPNERQIEALTRAIVLQGNVEETRLLCTQLSGLENGLKLPLIELAMPSLSRLTSMEKRNFLLILDSIINADGRVTLLELSVQWILERYLNPSEEMFRTITKFSISQAGRDIVLLLEALAVAGNAGHPEKARAAFDAGIARIPELAARRPDFKYEENASYANVSRMLKDLTAASFKIKETVIDACAHTAFADRSINVEEGELLRVVALALQCPLPPFVRPPTSPDVTANQSL